MEGVAIDQRDRVKEAEDNLRSAAKKWRLAWRSGEAKRVEQRAQEVAKMSAAERHRINQGAEVPTYDSKGWTQESTRTTEAGPWLNYDPPTHGTIETTSESSIGSIRLACGGRIHDRDRGSTVGEYRWRDLFRDCRP